jgi:hypothetical protein
MPIDCMVCSIDNDRNSPNCNYGETITTNCTVKNYAKCIVINYFFYTTTLFNLSYFSFSKG